MPAIPSGVHPGLGLLLATLLTQLAPAVLRAQELLPMADDPAYVAAQVAVAPVERGAAIPGSYLVQFTDRSFDLDVFRRAVLERRPATEIAALAADLEAAVQRDQAAFVRSVQALGGQVTQQWWIINGAAVEGLEGDGLALLGALPGVARVEPDRWQLPTNNTARDANHHEADQAGNLRNASGQLVRGAGVAVAVLDTGLDLQWGSTGLPHPAWFPAGTQTNAVAGGLGGSRVVAAFAVSGYGTEDYNGHGSHVGGSVASDNAGYRGIAPEASLVGVKISGSGTSGSAASSWLVSGWQTVAQQRVAYGIAVANNSFSGSPRLTDSIQMALDSTAYNADVLISCSAGNFAGDTTASQNVWNGLAVGSIDKNTLAVSYFSALGPLDNFGRTYPDITAVGANVSSVQLDSTLPATASGTSMASPMVAGGAALLRQAVPTLTALETKAILLATTKHTQTQRNSYGLGVMDCDAAVRQALAGGYHTVQAQGTGVIYSRDFSVSSGQPLSLVATWMHPPGGSFDNVDLRILLGGNVVASDGNSLNSYESVDFAATAGVTYTLELSRSSNVLASLDIAVAGIDAAPVTPPSLAAVSPAQVDNLGLTTITLTGNLDRIASLDVGGMPVTGFTNLTSSQLTFTLPTPSMIGSFAVTVTNAAGTSNAMQLQVLGSHPANLSAPSIGLRGVSTNLRLIGDAGWSSLMFLSNSTQPSALPGIVGLDLGANFTLLFQVGQGSGDPRGLLDVPFTLPVTVPSGAYVFQAITWDPAALTLPLEVSNRWTMSWF